MKRVYTFNPAQKPTTTSPLVAQLKALGLVGVIAAIADYVLLPAYNIHSLETLFLVAVYLGLYTFFSVTFSGRFLRSATLAIGGIGIILAFTLIASFLGSEWLNAERFRDQIAVTSETFSEDFDLVTFDKVPLVDYQTAAQLGDKQLGKVQGLGSQYNINADYTLVTAMDKIYRVSPLEYQDLYKWFQNRTTGIPGYVRVNVNDLNDVKLIELNQGIRYAPSAFFQEDLMRHVRFAYRTEILSDFSFEIDETGHPYYVISVIEPKIGFFSGWDAVGVIIVDAVSGDMTKYAIEDVPMWVDRVQPTDLAWYQIDNWGYYVNGFFNTLFGRKDVIQTTEGYNYVVIEGQVHVYSGMTSVGSDRSIVGFSLINLRTKAATYYQVGGADETSAMSSAQGQVQDLGYSATFPVLLNFEGVPSYFMSLKDNEGLIKQYALVSVTDYSVVGVGTSVEATKTAYRQRLVEVGLLEAPQITSTTLEVTITRIASAIVNGQSTYYVTVAEDPRLFVVDVNLSPEIVLSQVGDTVRLTFKTDALGATIDVLVFDNLAYDY
jgi:hypothetical protein